jgi:hypothetical protein
VSLEWSVRTSSPRRCALYRAKRSQRLSGGQTSMLCWERLQLSPAWLVELPIAVEQKTSIRVGCSTVASRLWEETLGMSPDYRG